MPSFASRLAQTFDEFGGVCVGIDPHPFLLETWGLSNDATAFASSGCELWMPQPAT